MYLLKGTRQFLSSYLTGVTRYMTRYVPYTHPTHVSCLESCMRIATEETSSPLVTVGLFFEAGPKYETPEKNGFSYYFERMAFKNTECNRRSEMECFMEINGIKLIVDTKRDHTVMYATCLNNQLVDIITYFGNAFDLSLTESDLCEERQQIPRNLCEKEYDNKKLTFDYLHQTAYQGTQFAQTIEGPTKNLRRLNNENIRIFLTERLQPWRMTMASSGGVSHETMLNVMKTSRFGDFLGNPCVRPQPPQRRFTGSQISFRNDALPYAHVAVAIEAPGFTSPDYIPMLTASSIISSWDRSQGGGKNNASELAQAMSITGDCESFESFYLPYADTGLWGIYFVANGKHLDDVMYNIQLQWMKLCNCLIESDVERGINATNTMLARKYSNQVLSCKDLGYQVLYTSYRWNYSDFHNALRNLTTKDISGTAYKYIYDRCPAVVAIGPIESLPDYVRIRAAMYWLRV